jgi:site-specific recombinase XerD
MTDLSGFDRHLRVLQALSPISASSYSSKVSEFMLWLQKAGRPADLNALTRRDVEDYL